MHFGKFAISLYLLALQFQMDFRTELQPPLSMWQIGHRHRVFTIGSCFADCLGSRFGQLQFDSLVNPFGVLYNPLTIFENVANSLDDRPVDKEQLVGARNLFFHYQFHSEHFETDPARLQNKLQAISDKAGEFLSTADFLFITLGTAFVYELRATKKTVANCHKMPSALFEKRMLSVQEIVQSFRLLEEKVRTKCPSLKVVFTVSPVRHTKDTLLLNSVSKSILRIACHQLTQDFSDLVSYFPSYELVVDDLRDYRFYKPDLIHPNEVAEKYIWEKFSDSFFDEKTKEVNKEITDIISAFSHRPFYPQSEEYQSFIKKLAEKVEKLNADTPVPRLMQELASKLRALSSN